MKRRAEEDWSSAKRSKQDLHPSASASVSSWMKQSSSSSAVQYSSFSSSTSSTRAAGTITATAVDVNVLYKKLCSVGLVQDSSSSAPSQFHQSSALSTSGPSSSTASRFGTASATTGTRAAEAGLIMAPSSASCHFLSTSGSSKAAAGSATDVHELYKQLLPAGLVNRSTSQEKDQPIPSSASTAGSAAATVDVHDLYRQLSAAGLVKDLPAPTVQDPFDPAQLKRRQTDVIGQLYSGRQCKTCGIRFQSDNSSIEYAKHLDWHFQQNRNAKKSYSTHRKWYPTQDEWIRRGEMEKKENIVEVESINLPVDDSTLPNFKLPDYLPASSTRVDACNACQDTFEVFWNDDKDSWYIKDAVEREGVLFHRSCL